MNSIETGIQAVEPQNRNRRFVPAERLVARQRFHFLVWTAFPFLAIVGWFLVQPHVAVLGIVFLLAMWVVTGCLGISIGFHRYYAHHSFEAHPALQIAMAAAGSMAAQGPVTYWVTVHRCHHQHSDDEEDPHSPQPLNKQVPLLRRIAAFLHGHMGWVLRHDIPIPLIYAGDLRNNRIVRFFDPPPTQILAMARDLGQSDPSPPPDYTRTKHMVDSVILSH